MGPWNSRTSDATGPKSKRTDGRHHLVGIGLKEKRPLNAMLNGGGGGTNVPISNSIDTKGADLAGLALV